MGKARNMLDGRETKTEDVLWLAVGVMLAAPAVRWLVMPTQHARASAWRYVAIVAQLLAGVGTMAYGVVNWRARRRRM